MAGFKNTATSVVGSVSELSYRLRNIITGWKPVHIIVCGPDDTVARAIFEKIAGLFDPTDVSMVWGQALWAKRLRARVMISWDPDDASRADDIERTLSPTRHIVWVLTVGEPSKLVSERSTILNHHFSQGADYRLDVHGPTRSLTQPGVISRSHDVLRIVNRYSPRTVVVKREDFASQPSQVYSQILDAVARQGGPSPGSIAAPEALIDNTSLPPLQSTEDEPTRIASQWARFPELADITKELGYPPPPRHRPAVKMSPRGIIVAFHTADEIYTAEANRLRGSLDALGLEYVISVVEPESSWVRTTLLKPAWIAPAREKLRGPLIYIDVDAFVHHDPWTYVSDLEADMAAMVDLSGQLYSGTLFINDTAGAQTILSEWKKESEKRRDQDTGTLGNTGDEGDQGVLKDIVEAEEAQSAPRFSFGRLPPNLATIFDRTGDYRLGPVVIEHLQASREVTQQTKRLQRRRERLSEFSD